MDLQQLEGIKSQQMKKTKNNILKNLPIKEKQALEAKKFEFLLQVMKMKEEMEIGHHWIALYLKCIDLGVDYLYIFLLNFLFS